MPPAPQFVGREAELDDLRALWERGTRGVIALVGLGGAGKTAVAVRLLDELCRPDHPSRPEGLFVWSFYQEPDAGYFLSESYRYFARGDPPAAAKGAGLLHLLRDALASGGPHLLVLDGLERVQRQEGQGPGLFGQIEDPLLRGLLTRVAEGMGETTVLVTSRFPLTDLKPFLDRGYQHRDIEGLALPAALDLLRRHRVQGDDATLAKLVQSYGSHALTLDHLGGLIGQFLGGDPARAPEAPELTSPGQDRQALRLARLLDAYQSHLPQAELALLCRLCLLQRSIRLEQLLPLFLCTPAVHVRTARHLETLVERIPVPKTFPAAFARELAESIRETITVAHEETPMAGPEDAFIQSAHQAVAAYIEAHELTIEDDIDAVVRLYGGQEPSHPTEHRPLSWKDQDALRGFISRYLEYRNHPLFSYKGPLEPLEIAFKKAGWAMSAGPAFADLSPADVVLGARHARRALQRFAMKHRALGLIRAQARLYQEKRRASGPLATLDATALCQVVTSLVGRHLVLREADGSLSVHPAVRDYFAHLATATERGFWHHLIGEQLVSLVQRPGKRLPEDQASLDLAEEAISHAHAAGQPGKAWNLYAHVLGGHRHLAWKLGEMARGLRILRGFDPCPDRWALGWYLRALGELDAAYEQNAFPYFRADIRLLQGRLTLVGQEADPPRSAIAEFLMGRSTQMPGHPLGCAVPRAQILLYQGRAAQAWLATEPEDVYEMIGWEDDRARCRLYRAEVAQRMGDSVGAHRLLDSAAGWVLHSGSVEHLCLYHLVRARIAQKSTDAGLAHRAVDEGLHLARQCGLVLYQIDLLCVQAELFLRAAEPAAAESAREAHRLASAADCQFALGAAEAGHLLGRSFIALKRPDEARTILEEVRAVRLRIGDFRAEQTEALIRSLD